jgi:hypothetical protein
MCSAVSFASPRISDNAMVKQPACAAPINSSGLVPGLPSNRLLNPYGYSLSAPLLVEIAPLPSLMPPCQAADPYVCITRSPSLSICSSAKATDYNARGLIRLQDSDPRLPDRRGNNMYAVGAGRDASAHNCHWAKYTT